MSPAVLIQMQVLARREDGGGGFVDADVDGEGVFAGCGL